MVTMGCRINVVLIILIKACVVWVTERLLLRHLLLGNLILILTRGLLANEYWTIGQFF